MDEDDEFEDEPPIIASHSSGVPGRPLIVQEYELVEVFDEVELSTTCSDVDELVDVLEVEFEEVCSVVDP